MPPRILTFVFFFISTYCIKAQTANFTADVTSGCAPLTVKFSDTSTGGASSWNWTFGNGNTSINQNSGATYTTGGTYSVKLSINNNASSKTITITVYDKPVVNFINNVSTGCSPLSVLFTDQSTAGSGSIATTDWVFGDGAISGQDSPTHVYNSNGLILNNYNVTLTVKNDKGCVNSLVKSSLITVKSVIADFNVDNALSCTAPATVNFTNQSAGSGTITYAWNFGDNTNASSTVSPSHIYQTSGNFTVSLKASSDNGCSGTTTKTNFISVATFTGTDFQASTLKACVGQNINFVDITTAPEVSRQWIFGNGSTSTAKSTATSYSTPGSYDVTLKLDLVQGCQTSVIKRIEVAKDAVPDFTITQQCGQNVDFKNTTVEGYTWQWQFGDDATSTAQEPSHKFSSSGTRLVRLTAFNLFGCSFHVDKYIQVAGNSLANFIPDKQTSCTEAILSGCAPFTIPFTNQSVSDVSLQSAKWIFGDNATAEWLAGNASTNGNFSPTHTYVNPGTYNMMLVVSSGIGCVDTLRRSVIVSNTTPTADFKVDKVTACVGDNLTFTDQSINANFWCWDFGDGLSPQSGGNVGHQYRFPGIYNVTLTAKNGGCTNVKTKQQLITILDPPVDFSFTKTCINPLSVNITNGSSNFDSFIWDFGDGNTDTQHTSPSHSYAVAGTYNVSLIVTNLTTGCSPKLSRNILVQDVHADFAVSPSDKICKNINTNFKDASKFAVSWAWDFKDGSQSTSPSPVKAYSTAGVYNVNLRVADSDGCADNKTIPVTVADINVKFSFTAESDCNEFEVTFKDASSAFPPITNWTWDFGDGLPVDNNTDPVHVFTEQRPYTITLTLQNADAICTLSLDNGVVFTTPDPDFSAVRTTVCLNEQVTFINASKNAQTYTWQLDKDVQSQAVSPSNAYAVLGKYDITLSAKDQYGCEVPVTKPAYITVTKPVANFSASQTSAECPPLITSFSDQSSTDVVAWGWDFGDGQSSSAKNATNTYVIPGNYDVELFVTDKTGCTDKYKVIGVVSVGGPYGSYTLNSDSICQNTTANFEVTATNTKNYIWDFGDGTVVETENPSVDHVYTSVTDCNLSLVLEDDKGCKVTIGKAKILKILPAPDLDFNHNPEYPFENESVNFKAIYKDDLNFLWTVDNSSTQTVPDFDTSFKDYGTHVVNLEATNVVGCHTFVEKELLVLADIITIPNVFTPNGGDNINAVLEIPGIEKGSWKLTVYNRWGREVYHNNNYQNQWDGGNLSSGVYYYHLVNNIRRDKQYKGYVQIIK